MATAKTLDQITADKELGPFALSEYREAIATLDGVFDRYGDALAAGQDVAKHLDGIIDVSTRRNAYTTNLEGLAKRMKVKVTIPPAKTLPDITRMLAHAGGDFTRTNRENIRKELTEQAAAEGAVAALFADAATPAGYARFAQGEPMRFEMERRILEMGAEIRRMIVRCGISSVSPISLQVHEIPNDVKSLLASLSGIPSTACITSWPMDRIVAKSNSEFARIAESVKRLEGYRNDATIAEQTSADYFRQAINDFAGGENQCLADLRQELITQRKWHESDPDFPSLQRKRKRIEEITAELDTIAPGTSRERNRREERDRVIQEVADLEPAIEQRRLSQIRELLAQAIAGKADARTAIETIVTEPGAEFPSGFAQAVVNARFEKAAAILIAAKPSRK
jgi:hypothetical protein